VIGKTYPPDWLWADASKYAEAVARFTAAGKLHNYEFRFRRTSGEVRTGLLFVETIQAGGRTCALATPIDITDRKRAEEERERLRQQLATRRSWSLLDDWRAESRTILTICLSVVLLHADSAPGAHLRGASRRDMISR
jgi:hypothetical protein